MFHALILQATWFLEDIFYLFENLRTWLRNPMGDIQSSIGILNMRFPF